MNGKVVVCLGCLVVGLAVLGVNALADLQKVIVASRIIAGDNDADNDSDLCVFDTGLNLLCDTDDDIGVVYNAVATGNYTHSGIAEAVVCTVDPPDNLTAWPAGDNWTSVNKLFWIQATDNATYFGHDNSTNPERNHIHVDIMTLEIGDGDLDEYGVISQRPKYDHPFFSPTPEYPSPTNLIEVTTLKIFGVVEENLPDNVTFDYLLESITMQARGGLVTGFDWDKMSGYLDFENFITCKLSDNARDNHDFYYERGAVDDPYWKWDCTVEEDNKDAWDWDNSTPGCDNDFPGYDVYPYLSNLGSWSLRSLSNRSSLALNTAYRDVIFIDAVGDDVMGDFNVLVTADRSMLIDNGTGEPTTSYVARYEPWNYPGVGYQEWWPNGYTAKFAGSPTKIRDGQLDGDAGEEFAIINRLDNLTKSQVRLYNSDLSLIAASTPVTGRFTALELIDLDDDGIDEVVVACLQVDNTSTIQAYSAAGSLLDQSDIHVGIFTGLAATKAPPGAAVEPTTCAEVWSMGYGMQTDLDQSCKIDWGDFSVFASNWLASNCGNPADFDGTCLVDWGDFSVFASTWLDCNDPTNMPPCIANW